MVFSLASSLSTAEGLIARGLMSCENATMDVFSDTTSLELAAANLCGAPAKIFDSDYEFPADVCTEGDDDECDTVEEIVIQQLCIQKTFVTSVEAALADSCEKDYIDTILTGSGIKPAAYDLEYLGMLACDDDDETSKDEIKHVCLAGDNPVLDFEELVADADALANGDSDSDSDGGDAGDGEDSAAGLVAFAGVSLAAAAMLA